MKRHVVFAATRRCHSQILTKCDNAALIYLINTLLAVASRMTSFNQAVASRMTSFNQLKCFIASRHSYAMLNLFMAMSTDLCVYSATFTT